MRAMKDSGVDWIGIVPEHWEMRRAKAMFRQSTSKGNDRLVLLSATQDRGVVDKSTLDSVVQVSEDADLSTFKTVHKNDFVISLRSFQGGFEISHEEGVISPAYTVFRQSKQTYPHFYRHLFKSYGFIDKINSLTVGIREGKNIQYVDFADMLLPYIPLAEQQRIAEFLDRKCAEVDEMIALQEQIIEELKAYKQSVITETVTKGLNPAAPMRDSGIEWIGSIPKHWEVCRMKNVCTQNPNSLSEKEDKELEFDYVDIGSVSFEKGIFKSEHYAFKDAPSRARRKASLGDLVMSTVRTYLRAIDIVNTEEKANYIYSTGFAVLTPFDKIKYQYLSYISKSQYFLEQVGILSKGINYPSINSTDLMTISIALPTLTEQKTIADYLDDKCADIDSLIQTKQSKIDSLKEYKKSIIYEYVTGKREVTE